MTSNCVTLSGFLQLKEVIHVMMDKYNKFIKWRNQFMYIRSVVMRHEIKIRSIGHHCLC
jgi:hypothetical protein